MRPTRRALLGLFCTLPAQAQARWPERPVRVIVPVAPGGSVDAVARLIGRHLGDLLGVPFVIESHAGAGGNIAFEMVASARPDGYTLLAGWDSVAINPAIYRSVPYDPLRDFAPVVQTVRAAQVLVVRPELPARDLAEFVALTRARPITLGSAGNGSIGHLAAEMVKIRTGAVWTHVPYRGGGPAMVDLLAGHIDALCLTLAAAIGHIRSGRMRAIGVSTAARAPALPEVPSFAEQGLEGYDVVSWQGLLAPAGTPVEIVQRLNAAVNRALALPEVAGQLASQALDAVGGPPEVLGNLLRADVARWPALVRAAGARLD